MIFNILATAGVAIILAVIWKSIQRARTLHFKSTDIYVIDGDTFVIKAHAMQDQQTLRVRPLGFDAPEMGQNGGQEAKIALRKAIAGGVSFIPSSTDQYGRVLAHVKTSKGSLARIMLASGHGHSCSQYAIIRFIETLPARLSGKGLWSGTILGFGVRRPSTFRKHKSFFRG